MGALWDSFVYAYDYSVSLTADQTANAHVLTNEGDGVVQAVPASGGAIFTREFNTVLSIPSEPDLQVGSGLYAFWHADIELADVTGFSTLLSKDDGGSNREYNIVFHAGIPAWNAEFWSDLGGLGRLQLVVPGTVTTARHTLQIWWDGAQIRGRIGTGTEGIVDTTGWSVYEGAQELLVGSLGRSWGFGLNGKLRYLYFSHDVPDAATRNFLAGMPTLTEVQDYGEAPEPPPPALSRKKWYYHLGE